MLSRVSIVLDYSLNNKIELYDKNVHCIIRISIFCGPLWPQSIHVNPSVLTGSHRSVLSSPLHHLSTVSAYCKCLRPVCWLLLHTGPDPPCNSCVNFSPCNCCVQGRTEGGIKIWPRDESATWRCLIAQSCVVHFHMLVKMWGLECNQVHLFQHCMCKYEVSILEYFYFLLHMLKANITF